MSADILQEQIKLQVGERHFETTKSTLTECTFFKALLSEDWRHNARADGSFYVDGDGDLFEIILLYLRRLVLPVFFDNVKGHDQLLYTALLQEADFYGIDRLKRWIEEKRYLKAVKVTVVASVQTDYFALSYTRKWPTLDEFSPDLGTEVQYYPTWCGDQTKIVKITKTTTIDREYCLSGWD